MTQLLSAANFLDLWEPNKTLIINPNTFYWCALKGLQLGENFGDTTSLTAQLCTESPRCCFRTISKSISLRFRSCLPTSNLNCKNCQACFSFQKILSPVSSQFSSEYMWMCESDKLSVFHWFRGQPALRTLCLHSRQPAFPLTRSVLFDHNNTLLVWRALSHTQDRRPQTHSLPDLHRGRSGRAKNWR